MTSLVIAHPCSGRSFFAVTPALHAPHPCSVFISLNKSRRSEKSRIVFFHIPAPPCFWFITSQYLSPLSSCFFCRCLSSPSFGGGDGDGAFPLDQTEILVLSDDATAPPAPTTVPPAPTPSPVSSVTPTGDLEPVGIIPLATSRTGEASDLYALKVRFLCR